ncbi:MAG: NYN domain-containing protein [Alphaproteobacteria bacterium]|nr:MAG: NYN domain-containing protein [Alphaproteobacteria bacterium]
MFYEDERIAVFIDGSNLYLTARNLGLEIDYRKLKEFFSERGRLLRAFYYTAIADDQDYSPIRPLIDWLDYNGYTVVTKPLKEFTDENGRRRVKGNMDVEIAVDMLNLAEHVDHVVLFSGDGDFRRVIESVQRRGVRVTVVSSTATQPPMIADELRRQADHFLELKTLGDAFLRPRRPARALEDDDHEQLEMDESAEDMADELAGEFPEEE